MMKQMSGRKIRFAAQWTGVFFKHNGRSEWNHGRSAWEQRGRTTRFTARLLCGSLAAPTVTNSKDCESKHQSSPLPRPLQHNYKTSLLTRLDFHSFFLPQTQCISGGGMLYIRSQQTTSACQLCVYTSEANTDVIICFWIIYSSVQGKHSNLYVITALNCAAPVLQSDEISMFKSV